MEHTDKFYLSFATGWLELGNTREAHNELDQVSSAFRKSREALTLEWQIWVAEKNWMKAHFIARELWRKWPRECSHWLSYAYAIRRIPDGGLEKAWDTLLKAAERFPDEPVVAYNLSCYACQLGRMDKARAWYFRALEKGPKKELKQMALRDPDLQPLWAEIKRL